jgi:hypothetical protein
VKTEIEITSTGSANSGHFYPQDTCQSQKIQTHLNFRVVTNDFFSGSVFREVIEAKQILSGRWYLRSKP